jgi:hypothetical protein
MALRCAAQQPPTMPVIGYLNGASAAQFPQLLAGFQKGGPGGAGARLVLGSILRPSVLLPFASLGKGAADSAAQKSMGMHHGH